MIPLPSFITDYFKQIIASVVVLGLGVGSCMLRDASIEKRGEVKAVTKIEKATDNAAQSGKRAAAQSAAPGVRGVRDPYTRDDKNP